MIATITRPFSIAPEGHTTFQFKPGDRVTGVVAEAAIAAGCAHEVKIQEPLETHYEPGEIRGSGGGGAAGGAHEAKPGEIRGGGGSHEVQEPLETHYEPGAHEVRFDEPAPAPKKSRRKSKDT